MSARVSLDDVETTASTLVDLGLAPCALITLSVNGEQTPATSAAAEAASPVIKLVPELEQQLLVQ